MAHKPDADALTLAALRQRSRLRGAAELLVAAIDDGATDEELLTLSSGVADIIGSLLLIERVRRGEHRTHWSLLSDS